MKRLKVESRVKCFSKIALTLLIIMIPMRSNAGTDADPSFKIVVAPSVLEQLQKASAEERKQQEKAVMVGNSYVPYHYNGLSYRDTFSPAGKKSWLKNVRPLINRDLNKWLSPSDIEGKLHVKIDGIPGGKLPGLLVVCPQIELAEVTPASEHYSVDWDSWNKEFPVNYADDSFELQYRTKIIGALDDAGIAPRFFLPISKEEYAVVVISLDKQLKVSRVMNKYFAMTLTPNPSIDQVITIFVSGVVSHDVPPSEKVRLRSLITKIKEEESKRCGT